MADEQKQSNTQPEAPTGREFWFAVVFTAFLAVTFGLYLPLRFQNLGDGQGMTAGHIMGPSQYHEETSVREGLLVNMNIVPVPPAAGTSTRLDFFVNQKPGGTPVADLEIEHEKFMHVIGVRNDLNEFFHIHPVNMNVAETMNAGIWRASHVFTKPGLYKVWSEVKRAGVNHAFGHPEFSVEGPGERESREVSFDRSAAVGEYRVALNAMEPIPQKQPAQLSFEVKDASGRGAALEPYLGASMHLTVIKDDWKQFIHTHPVVVGSSESKGFSFVPEALANGVHPSPTGIMKRIPFAVVFPEPGLYKAFAQFRPQGKGLPPDEAFTVGFWLRVESRAPFRVQLSKGALAAISLVLIIVLSFIVKRFLGVRV